MCGACGPFAAAAPRGKAGTWGAPPPPPDSPSLCRLLQLSRSPPQTRSSPSRSSLPRAPVRWATPVKERTAPSSRHPQAACPPAPRLSGPCSLNAHFVPLSTGLIDINSCAQSAHSVFSWPGAGGVCVIIFNGRFFQGGMKYELAGREGK